MAPRSVACPAISARFWSRALSNYKHQICLSVQGEVIYFQFKVRWFIMSSRWGDLLWIQGEVIYLTFHSSTLFHLLLNQLIVYDCICIGSTWGILCPWWLFPILMLSKPNYTLIHYPSLQHNPSSISIQETMHRTICVQYFIIFAIILMQWCAEISGCPVPTLMKLVDGMSFPAPLIVVFQ